MRRINIDDEADRWRYRCPVGHRTWRPTNHHFICIACSRSSKETGDEEIDPSFDELRDLATDELLARDDIVLDTKAGLYSDVATDGGVE